MSTGICLWRLSDADDRTACEEDRRDYGLRAVLRARRTAGGRGQDQLRLSAVFGRMRAADTVHQARATLRLFSAANTRSPERGRRFGLRFVSTARAREDARDRGYDRGAASDERSAVVVCRKLR